MSSYETIMSVWDKTLRYSNIFDYPLTQDEIYMYALTKHAIERDRFDRWYKKNVTVLKDAYAHDGHLWAVKGRERLFAIRRIRNKIARDKFITARGLMAPFWFLPWVRMVGITGTVAAGNAIISDDVDLYVVTAKGRKWVTRLLLLGYFSLLRRRYNEKRPTTATTFCVNHVVEEDALGDSHHDVYIANELSRVKVVFSKKDIHMRLYKENHWVMNFLPHWFAHHIHETNNKKDVRLDKEPSAISVVYFVLSAPFRMPFVVMHWISDMLEKIAQRIQEQRLISLLGVVQSTDALIVHRKDNRTWILREVTENV